MNGQIHPREAAYLAGLSPTEATRQTEAYEARIVALGGFVLSLALWVMYLYGYYA